MNLLGKIERREGGLWRGGGERKEGKMEGKEGWRKVRKGCEEREEPCMAVDKTLGMVGGDLPWPQFRRIHSEAMLWDRTSWQQGPRMKQGLGSDRGLGRMKSGRTRNPGEARNTGETRNPGATSAQAQFTHSSADCFVYLPSFPPPGRIYIYTESPVFLTVVLKSKLSLLQPKHICFSLL